jgi:hypothetical protein
MDCPKNAVMSKLADMAIILVLIIRSSFDRFLFKKAFGA